MAMKWIQVLVDEHTLNCLRDLEGTTYRYKIVAEDSRAFGALTRGFVAHELDLEDPKDGLPK